MKNDLDQTLRESLSGAAPAEIHARMEQHFAALAAQVRRPGARAAAPQPASVLSRWLWPGLSLAGAAALAVLLFGLFGSSTVSWARVVERFRALPFFGITVYVSDHSELPAEKIEIWATSDHRSRVHYRGLLFFGKGSEPVKIVQAQTGEEIAADSLKDKQSVDPAIDLALHMQESLGRTPHFSLDEIVRFFSGKREDLRPVANVDADFAADLQVFDLTTARSPEWLRLWVLKKSELPVRIRSFDPRQAGQVEAVFDYFTRMPDDAFDPAKVRASIRGKQGGANKLYALLKDPGGRPLTPEDLLARDGYHLPEVAAVGRTTEGVVWVQSHRAVQQRADGRTFYGWGQLTDDLGQEYLRVEIGHRLDGDLQEEYYIPLGLGADFQKPSSYTLTCGDREDDHRRFYRDPPTTVIGSAEVRKWSENSAVPKLFGDDPSPAHDDFVRRLLSEFVELESWPRFDALAATIAGAPEENRLAFFRDLKLSRKLDLLRQRPQAATLRARLFPLCRVKGGSWEEWELVEDHLCDLVRAGQREGARTLANQYVADLPRQREIHIGRLVFKLHEAGMNRADIRGFFDEDVLSLPWVKEDLARTSINRGEQWTGVPDPRFAAWRAWVEKLSARYDSRSLPAECEFIEDFPALPKDDAFTPLPLPGHEEFLVIFVAGVPARALAPNTAPYRSVDDPSLMALSPAVTASTPPVVCVHRSTMKWSQVWDAYLKANHLEVVENVVHRRALVARYDGRKLPNCFQVPPLNCSQLGTVLVREQNSAEQNTPTSVLQAFASSLNFGRPEDDPKRVIVLNETGLPDQPGENQSAANVGLVYDMAFWSGQEASRLAMDWFRENFGITFQEEERELKGFEIRPLTAATR